MVELFFFFSCLVFESLSSIGQFLVNMIFKVRSESPSQGPLYTNYCFLKNGSDDLDYISVICGDSLPK